MHLSEEEHTSAFSSSAASCASRTPDSASKALALAASVAAAAADCAKATLPSVSLHAASSASFARCSSSAVARSASRCDVSSKSCARVALG